MADRMACPGCGRALTLTLNKAGASQLSTYTAGVHELKIRRHRGQVHKVGSGVAIFSRNGHDFAERLPATAQMVHELPARSAAVEGQVGGNDAKIFGLFVQTTISKTRRVESGLRLLRVCRPSLDPMQELVALGQQVPRKLSGVEG